jgi:hypothetical protein
MTDASGATYLLDTHRRSPSIRSSKYRTGDTSLWAFSIRGGMSWVGSRTHPLVSFPWNRTDTSDPAPASNSSGSS